MKPSDLDLLADPWACGPWCWVIDEVHLLPEPVPCRGAQGLWHVGEAMSAALSQATGLGTYRWWQALTVLQPFATAIAHGGKRVENRPWRLHLSWDGMWLGLHAGKALAGAREEVDDALDDWRIDRWPDTPALADMPRGAMLGAMHISVIVQYPADLRERAGGGG